MRATYVGKPDDAVAVDAAQIGEQHHPCYGVRVLAGQAARAERACDEAPSVRNAEAARLCFGHVPVPLRRDYSRARRRANPRPAHEWPGCGIGRKRRYCRPLAEE